MGEIFGQKRKENQRYCEKVSPQRHLAMQDSQGPAGLGLSGFRSRRSPTSPRSTRTVRSRRSRSYSRRRREVRGPSSPAMRRSRPSRRTRPPRRRKSHHPRRKENISRVVESPSSDSRNLEVDKPVPQAKIRLVSVKDVWEGRTIMPYIQLKAWHNQQANDKAIQNFKTLARSRKRGRPRASTRSPRSSTTGTRPRRSSSRWMVIVWLIIISRDACVPTWLINHKLASVLFVDWLCLGVLTSAKKI